eukprot:Nk52_evm16s2496 gene=Nk52_evmTU16s2496
MANGNGSIAHERGANHEEEEHIAGHDSSRTPLLKTSEGRRRHSMCGCSGTVENQLCGNMNCVNDDDSFRFYRREAGQLFKMGLPIVLTGFNWNMTIAVNLMFLGRMGAEELAAASLAGTYATVTGWAVCWGLASAMDTFVSQSLGMQNYVRAGIIVQRTLIFLFLVSVPITILWLNAEAVFLKLGQPATVSALAGSYFKHYVFSLHPSLIYITMENLMQARGYVRIPTAVTFVTLLFNIFSNYFFIFVLDYGFVGGPLAYACTSYFSCILICLVAYFYPLSPKIWYGWNKACLEKWGEFCSLAIPSIFLMCFELFGFEITTFFAGMLGTKELGAHSIATQFVTTLYMLPFALGVTSSLRVGIYMGQGAWIKARVVGRVSVVVIFFMAIFQSCVLYTSGGLLSHLFSSDSDVLRLVDKLLIFIAVLEFFDNIQVVNCGVIRGCGKQAAASVCHATGFFVVALPLGYYLAFKGGYGLEGIWIGLVVGVLTVMTASLLVTFFLDWEQTSKDARLRASEKIAVLGSEGTKFDEQEINNPRVN